jgi:tetratricopeptide (TPR) repeat protein
MKRLTRAQFASLKLLITALIAADLFAIWVWATRPPRIYSDLLGLTGLGIESPFRRLVAWAAWDDGPRTPSGCLALFDAAELSFSGVLLLALVFLTLFLLSPRETDGTAWRRISAKVSALQFRLRTTLALLAIIGVYLGWEVHAWRTWGLRSDFRRLAGLASRGVDTDLSDLQSVRKDVQFIRGNERKVASARRGAGRSSAAAASDITVEDLKREEMDVLLAKLVAHTELKVKYERAAANPRNSVAPSRPMPKTAKEAADWLDLHDFGRALAVYDELARTYPQLVEAHSRSAWLRATCPDAQCRDGKRAVESAGRACELTDWHKPAELEVLAAACAEAGDFESAVKWQKKVLALTPEPAGVQSCQQRLALYHAGKAFRVDVQRAQ